MLSIFSSSDDSTASRVSRRELLRIGGLSLLGLTTADLVARRAQGAGPAAAVKARSCIFVFLFGGPSHIDLWDMKPDAPRDIRGQFSPAATNVPGIQICEHLPQIARQMDKLCLLRSMMHEMPVHGPACSEMYSGRPYFGPPITDEARPEDWPSLASLVMRYGQTANRLPPSLVIPWYTQFSGQSRRIAGQTGGRMGDRFDPVMIEGDPSQVEFAADEYQPRNDVTSRRLQQRRALLARWQQELHRGAPEFGPVALGYARHAEMAQAMLERPEFARALNLQSVAAEQRERYGMTRFGQSLLMAKRLVESGISLVTVNWDDESRHDKVSPFWDTHHDNFSKLKDNLCPHFDQSFAAFIDDMAASGLLESTLIVVTGEFGRTPRIGQISQNAMTQKSGRDHWPHAFTVLLAGGGVPAGTVYGRTDRQAAFVDDLAVTPADLAATILDYLGVDRTATYDDEVQQVTRHVCEGKPIRFP